MKKSVFYKTLSLLLIFAIMAGIVPAGLITSLASDQTELITIVNANAGFKPRSVAMCGGNTYFIDNQTLALYKVDDAGSINKIVLEYEGSECFSTGGLAADGSGKLYVTSTGCIFVLDGSTGGNISRIATEGYQPAGIAVNNSGSDIYFLEISVDSKIYHLDSNGIHFVTDKHLELSNPFGGIALDQDGNLYIADTGNNQIKMVDPQGNVSVVAGNGTVDFDANEIHEATGNGFSAPSGVAVDNSGNLYFTSINAQSVILKVYEENGTRYIKILVDKVSDIENDYLLNPRGVAIGQDGNLYIADTGNGRVLKYQPVEEQPTSPPQPTPSPQPVPEPVINPGSGTYASSRSISVEIAAPLTTGQSVHYVINEAKPSVDGPIYTVPFSLNLPEGTTYVRAAVYDEGSLNWGGMATAVYTVNSNSGDSSEDTPPPVVVPVTATPPAITIPEVNTWSASEVGLTETTLNGNVADSGGDTCMAVNFHYRLKGSSEWKSTDTQTVSLDNGGSFSAKISGLKVNSEYEFKARACNSKDWGEGSLETFKTKNALPATVITNVAENINPDQAAISGTVTDNGGAGITECGFLWGKAADGNMKKVQTKTDENGKMSFDLTELEKDTEYIFQAYAVNAAGISYGDKLKFKTPVLPSPDVETLAATGVEVSGAVLHGRIKQVPGSTKGKSGKIRECGFKISVDVTAEERASIASADSAPSDKLIKAENGPDASGNFSVNMTGLKPGIKYTFSAYVINESGTGNGEALVFTTLSNEPEVITQETIGATSNSVFFLGHISKNKGFKITECGFLWGTNPEPENKYVLLLIPEDTRTMVYMMKDLMAGMTYYVKAYAINSQGTGYGKVVSFTTQASIPIVKTLTSSFHASDWEVALNGEIVHNGGADLTEYGFRVSRDKKNWSKYVISESNYKGAVNSRISGADKLTAGTWYYQMYAVNSNGTAYGDVLQFDTPAAAKVTATIDQSAVTMDSAILTGNITDTGADNMKCSLRKFQFRTVGSSAWLEAGLKEGSFGKGEFKYSLTGLEPALKYEFKAMAYNAAGWGASAAVTFTAGFGATDQEAAVNMKKAGYAVTDIAEEIKELFKDTGDQLLQALEFAGFGAADIASALKGEAYAYTWQEAVTCLKKGGFDILTVAKALQSAYLSEVRGLYYGILDYGTIAALNKTGYTIDEVLPAVKTLYNLSIAQAVDKIRTGSSGLYTYDDLYGAVGRVYGLKELAKYIWYQGTYWNVWNSLISLAKILRTDAGATAEQTSDTLKYICPSMSISYLSDALKYAGYSVPETGNQLIRVFGADMATAVKTLRNTNFLEADIEVWLIKDRNFTALQTTQLMSLYWSEPHTSIPAVLSKHYGMTAMDTAKMLYQAGWTEANVYSGSKNHSLNCIDDVMVKYYGMHTPGEIVKVYKEIGLSPLFVAGRLRVMTWAELGVNSGNPINWIAVYKEQGYTATDAAAYYKSKSTNGALVISYLAGSYSILDIALAIRSIYGFDSVSALNAFRNENKSFSLAWKETDIVKAISDAYGMDPIPALIAQMKNSGIGASTVAGTLKDSFQMTDPLQAASYLAKAGYEELKVIDALQFAYFADSRDGVTIQKLIQIAGTQYNQKQEECIGIILRAIGCPSPAAAVQILKEAGYSIKDIALALKNGYSQSINQTIDELIKRGCFKQPDIVIGVMAAFGIDPVPGVIQNKKSAGDSPEKIAASLYGDFGISEPEKLASYLAQAGYQQKDVLGALLKVFYPQGEITAAAMDMMNKVIQRVYANTADSLRIMLEAAGIKAPAAAISLLQSAGYKLNDIIIVLKDIYSVTAGQATDLLTTSGLFDKENITAGIQTVYGGDYILTFIQFRKSCGDSTLQCYLRLVGEFGLKDSIKIVKYFVDAGYSELDSIRTILTYARGDIPAVLKVGLGLTEPEDMAKYYKEKLGTYVMMQDAANGLKIAFGGITSFKLVKALRYAGYPLYGDTSIVGWIRTYEENGQRDDALAAILGTANPGDLGVRPIDATEILQTKGYSIEEVANWLKKDGYTLAEMFSAMDSRYDSKGDNKVSVLKVFKDMGYSIEEIAKADYDFMVGGSTQYGALTFGCAWVYNDLLALDYSMEEAVRILMKIGAQVSDLVQIMYDYSIEIANEANNQRLRLTAKQIALILYNVAAQVPERKITLMDIVKGVGDAANGQFACWSRSAAVDAVMAIEDKAVDKAVDAISNAGINVGGMMREGSAFGMLKDTGWSHNEAVSAMASRGTGLNDAFITMLIAGYSFTDTVSALYNNTSYKIAISSKLAFSAMTAGLSLSFDIADTWILNAAANFIINSAVKTAATTAITELVVHDLK